jgi:hypothetical protein
MIRSMRIFEAPSEPIARAGGAAGSAARLRPLTDQRRLRGDAQRTGIGIDRSTGTAVTLFCGEPSITRSE